jgi:hypothetical protein
VTFTLPVRLVRDRIHYLDLARQPYTPPFPDYHHRNETLFHAGDASVALPASRAFGKWTAGASLGVSVPTGRTEPNPFVLGALGLPHQHIQFGSGTWDPLLGLSASRKFGVVTASAVASARLTLDGNPHGYRAGDRTSVAVSAGRAFATVWSANAGLAWFDEQAERWNGQVQSEGNLGRTDLDFDLAVARTTPDGTWSVNAQVPTFSRSVGNQVRYPVTFSISWTR